MPPKQDPVLHDEEASEEDLTEATAGPNMSEFLRNPELVAAVQSKLNGLLGIPSGFVEMLPECVKKRVNALKNIQLECTKLEGKFYEEAHQLEMKYAELFKPLYEKRSIIVNGDYEPNEEESTWVEPLLEDDEMETDKSRNGEEDEKTAEEKAEQHKFAEEVKSKLNLDMDENTRGIPEFWLTAMKNVELFNDMIKEHDEEPLKYLNDIKLIFTGKQETDEEMGFVLEFLFNQNEYFTNTALTKTYKFKCEPDSDDPFSFEGPDIISCTGCKIDWKEGKNITQKQVKKKQKQKGRAQTRVVVKTVQNDSFFNFFNPPEVPENEDEDVDEDVEAVLAADYEIGHFFRERFIPKMIIFKTAQAVLFYTGEAIEDESDDEDELEDEEEEDDDDDDDGDENDPDWKPPEGGEKPQECKQQ